MVGTFNEAELFNSWQQQEAKGVRGRGQDPLSPFEGYVPMTSFLQLSG
jgi:hypothetical protein